MIKCDNCNKELNENEFPLRDYTLLICDSCFFNAKTEFEKKERGDICPICGTKNCKKKENDCPEERDLEKVKKAVNRLKDYNEALEDDKKQKEILKAIINNIKEDIKFIYNKKDEELDEGKYIDINLAKKFTRTQRIYRLNEAISSEYSNLMHSINQIECNVAQFEINESLLDITKNIKKLLYYLYYKKYQESKGLK